MTEEMELELVKRVLRLQEAVAGADSTDDHLNDDSLAEFIEGVRREDPRVLSHLVDLQRPLLETPHTDRLWWAPLP